MMIKSIIKCIRSSILCCAFGIFGLGALFFRYFVFPVQKFFIKENEYDKYKYSEILQKSWRFIIWLLKITKIIVIKGDIEKIKNIKNKIIVSTHTSFLDVVILISLIPHSTCFVAEKLGKNPFFKGIVELLFILKGQDLERWTSDACEMLDNGMSIIIFPMGGRHKKSETPKLRKGASLLALKSKKDIIILNMKTNFDFLQKGQPFYDAGSELVQFNITCLGQIIAGDFLQKYPDEVDFKTELTNEIQKIIYS